MRAANNSESHNKMIKELLLCQTIFQQGKVIISIKLYMFLFIIDSIESVFGQVPESTRLTRLR